MNTVNRHIQYLAATTDCVIIPGWGGLIASYRKACVANGEFLPPERSLVFNPALSHDDGRLAMSLVRREKISYEAARAEIAAEVGAMKAEFESTGSVKIRRIGSFTRATDGTMLFASDPRSVANARFAALAPLAVEPEVKAEPAAVAEEPAAVNIVPRESVAKRLLRVAAFVAILLGLALTLSTPISVNMTDAPDFAGIGTTASRRAPFTVDTMKPAGALFRLAVPDSASAPVAVKPVAADETHRYFLIIGSLETRAKAERWMAKRPEKNLGIISRGSRHRVYAATGATVEEAMRLKSDPDFARRNPDAWVYKSR